MDLVTRVHHWIYATDLSLSLIKRRDYPGREAAGEVGHCYFSSVGVEACVGWYWLLWYPVWSHPNRADRRRWRSGHQSWHWLGFVSEDHPAWRRQLCSADRPASWHYIHSHTHTEGQPGLPELASSHLYYTDRCSICRLIIIQTEVWISLSLPIYIYIYRSYFITSPKEEKKTTLCIIFLWSLHFGHCVFNV